MAATVCLFDIDGTLLLTGGAGQLGMERALTELFGITRHEVDIPSAGRTDRAITTDLFQHHGIELTEDHLARFVAAYDRHLPAALASTPGKVLPGVPPLLDVLHSKPNLALGLLTGNYRVGAAHKLQHFQLAHYFEFGGYGDDHLHRDDVARLAYAAACAQLQQSLDPQRIWVIGDTPADVQCARAIGARVVAVATGMYSAAELSPTQPDELFETLAELDRFLSLLD